MKSSILEYAALIASFEIGVVLDYCTRTPENPAVLQTTTGRCIWTLWHRRQPTGCHLSLLLTVLAPTQTLASLVFSTILLAQGVIDIFS